MKKVFLSLLACGSIAAANAQGVLVFGDVGYTSHTHGTESVFPGLTDKVEVKDGQFSFNPGIGYMINRNIAVGVQIRGTGTRTMYTSNDTSFYEHTDRGFDLVVGPFFRYTMPINQTFFTYTQVSVGYKFGTFKYETEPTDYTDKYNGFAAELYPAVGVNVTPCMALAISFGGLSYDRYKWDNDLGPSIPSGFESHDTYSNFNFNFGQQMHLTVQWTFGNKAKARGNRAPGDDYREMRMDRDDRNEDRNDNRRRRNNDEE